MDFLPKSLSVMIGVDTRPMNSLKFKNQLGRLVFNWLVSWKSFKGPNAIKAASLREIIEKLKINTVFRFKS